jgi:hypothetical protein
VLTRQLSRTGDTITYTIRTQQRVQVGSFQPGGGPAGVIYPPTTTTLRAIVNTTELPELTANLPLAQLLQIGGGYFASAAARNSARFRGRIEHSILRRGICGPSAIDSVGIGEPCTDCYVLFQYAVGLGLTYSNFIGFPVSSTDELTAFRKGTQTWGTFFGPAVLLAAHGMRPATTTTVFPNPFSETLTAAFVLASAQPVGLFLYDALGRQVRAVPAVRLGAGSQRLAVPTAGLPAGVYTLHLLFASEGRREVLKVTKAD